MKTTESFLTKYFFENDKWIQFGFYTLCLTVFLMPFPRSWSLYSLGVFLFLGLIVWLTDTRQIFNHFVEKLRYLLPMFLFFFLYFIYFLLNKKWDYIEDKLMFILIPLLGFPMFDSIFFKNKIHQILFSFITGIIIICIYQLTRVTVDSLTITNEIIKFDPFISPQVSRYNWMQLSSFEHPTYLAIKIMWAVTLLLLANGYTRFTKPTIIFYILVFTIFIFLLSSRTGIIIFIIIFIHIIYIKLKTFRKRVLLLILIPFLLYGSFKLVPLSHRMNEQLNMLKNSFTSGNIEWWNIDPRTRAWYSSLILIKGKPLFGVGPDSRNKLTEVYKVKGFTAEAYFMLNAHNQYLETQLAFGIPGTAILLMMLIIPLMRRKEIWLKALVWPFFIIISVSMFFESILVRQWGIMFFVLFSCILLIPDKPGSEKKAVCRNRSLINISRISL